MVVLDIDRAEFLAVNRSGAPLWNLLAGGASRDQLVRALVERYDAGCGRRPRPTSSGSSPPWPTGTCSTASAALQPCSA